MIETQFVSIATLVIGQAKSRMTSMMRPSRLLQQMGASVASLPLAPTSERRYCYSKEAESVHDMAAIMLEILRGYSLPVRCAHGVVHWARVLENGLRVAESNGADREVVALFAMFHDSRRINECRDDGHGLRAGQFARSLRGTLVHLDDARFDLLFEACRLHTCGLTEGDPTLQACWDADRLDLARVGIMPMRHRLCTDSARDLLEWANARAVSNHEPAEVLASWGLRQGTPRHVLQPPAPLEGKR